MPKKCCVIGCKSGYDTNKEKVSTFRFPTDQNLKKKWLEAIGRKDYKPTKYSAVCHKHFLEVDVIRHCIGIDPNTGTETLFPNTKVKLKEGAIPVLNLGNPSETKACNVTEKMTRSSKRGRPPKSAKPQQDHSSSSSDEDIPLKTLQNQYSVAKDKDTSFFGHTNDDKSDADPSTGDNAVLAQQFFELLDKYEKLKDRHVALGHEIEVLEKVNIHLKCKIFQF